MALKRIRPIFINGALGRDLLKARQCRLLDAVALHQPGALVHDVALKVHDLALKPDEPLGPAVHDFAALLFEPATQKALQHCGFATVHVHVA